MSGKKFTYKTPAAKPKRPSAERVVSERGRKELPPGTKGGENLKPDRHYEHKQHAFDSYCKKVLKYEAYNGYAYKYTDACGKTQFVYAWKLVPTDKTPTGKRDDISLREKVKEILRDLNDGIDTIGKKMTVCQLYARQNSHRKNVKRSTEKGREYLMSVLKSDPLGSRSIDTVKLSDAKEWAIRMSEKGYAYKTISNWKRSLKAAFYTAIKDDCIRKNPFNFAMDTVLEDDTEEKVALTQEQEDRLLAFAGSDPVYRKYCDEIIVLLGTGLRISELCGLTVDLDFENRRIDVDHQLLRDSELGYYVDAPKTKNGVRQIPMSEKVY